MQDQIKKPVGRPIIKDQDRAKTLTISIPAKLYKKLSDDELTSSSKLIQKLLTAYYKEIAR